MNYVNMQGKDGKDKLYNLLYGIVVRNAGLLIAKTRSQMSRNHRPVLRSLGEGGRIMRTKFDPHGKEQRQRQRKRQSPKET
jgi:hypothetical protein